MKNEMELKAQDLLKLNFGQKNLTYCTTASILLLVYWLAVQVLRSAAH